MLLRERAKCERELLEVDKEIFIRKQTVSETKVVERVAESRVSTEGSVVVDKHDYLDCLFLLNKLSGLVSKDENAKNIVKDVYKRLSNTELESTELCGSNNCVTYVKPLSGYNKLRGKLTLEVE
jgi:hypothetical protein